MRYVVMAMRMLRAVLLLAGWVYVILLTAGGLLLSLAGRWESRHQGMIAWAMIASLLMLLGIAHGVDVTPTAHSWVGGRRWRLVLVASLRAGASAVSVAFLFWVFLFDPLEAMVLLPCVAGAIVSGSLAWRATMRQYRSCTSDASGRSEPVRSENKPDA